MKVSKLNVELYADIASDGIHTSVFLGDVDMPSAETVLSWDDLIDKEIEFNTLVGGGVTTHDGVDDLFDVVNKLRQVANDLEKRIMELQAFDREKWVASGNKDKESYCMPMEEYLKYRNLKENFEKECG